jgi:hypothetical protein
VHQESSGECPNSPNAALKITLSADEIIMDPNAV